MAPFSLQLVKPNHDPTLSAEPSQPPEQLVSGHRLTDTTFGVARQAALRSPQLACRAWPPESLERFRRNASA
jgi:hypothetical protein